MSLESRWNLKRAQQDTFQNEQLQEATNFKVFKPMMGVPRARALYCYVFI